MKPRMSEPSAVSIVGFPHSGSTLLGDLLGVLPGVFHAGEMAQLFRRTVRGPRSVCSCGVAITSCEIWGPAMAAALAGYGGSLEEIAGDIDRVVNKGAEAPPYLASVYRTLLREAATRSDSTCIVDSSNWPAFGRVLHEAAQPWPVGYVHLVRDPRGAVHSRTRNGQNHELASASRLRVMASVYQDARRWNAWNAESEQLARLGDAYAVVRYEDLVRDPGTALRAFLAAMDLPALELHTPTVELRRAHVIWGNRGAKNGSVELRLDDRWHRESPLTRRLLTAAVTFRSQRGYGYP